MKLVETEDSFELQIYSAVTDNFVKSKDQQYYYKRLVIPSLLANYFLDIKPNTKYVYLYFVDDSVFLSIEKLDDYKFSKRKLMKLQNKYKSYFINLNVNSLTKHDIHVGSNVLFKVCINNSRLNSISNICIELIFYDKSD